ncbi:Hypothetical predicted protein [Paramuricea clavata]|uniref:Uncharacterized protein n=1 Tax=Paramuricea clavata TaxID=317549 RepID=A0A7D9LB72_PARCT|nr:Hypothetical predicted protein [Paramuricea clavata]
MAGLAAGNTDTSYAFFENEIILGDPSSSKNSCTGGQGDVQTEMGASGKDVCRNKVNLDDDSAGFPHSETKGWTKLLQDIPPFTHRKLENKMVNNSRTILMPDKVAPKAHGNMKKGYGLWKGYVNNVQVKWQTSNTRRVAKSSMQSALVKQGKRTQLSLTGVALINEYGGKTYFRHITHKVQTCKMSQPWRYFSELEKSIIRELVAKHKDILESKKKDYKMIKQKNSAWETLTEEFNSQAGVYKQIKKRNISSLELRNLSPKKREK